MASSNPYFKSLIWLVSLGGIGYGLLRLTEPSEEKLNKIKQIGGKVPTTAEEKKKALFMQKLKEAAEGPPVYLKKKEN